MFYRKTLVFLNKKSFYRLKTTIYGFLSLIFYANKRICYITKMLPTSFFFCNFISFLLFFGGNYEA